MADMEATVRFKWSTLRVACLALGSALFPAFACSDDETQGGECGGAVAGVNEAHCEDESGAPIEQAIGACVTSADALPDEGEEHDHEHEEEEEHEPFFGNQSVDDDCKYRVSFDTTCVALNRPVTFTLSLTRLFDDMPGAGTNPAYPEIFLESDATHISPSNDIRATETAPGVYDIGPVVFDRSGRWVIRFHYFEACSDLTEDSPHGHAAFYIDVP